MLHSFVVRVSCGLLHGAIWNTGTQISNLSGRDSVNPDLPPLPAAELRFGAFPAERRRFSKPRRARCGVSSCEPWLLACVTGSYVTRWRTSYVRPHRFPPFLPRDTWAFRWSLPSPRRRVEGSRKDARVFFPWAISGKSGQVDLVQ